MYTLFPKPLLLALGNLANRFLDRYTGGTQRPSFFDVKSTRPELMLLKDRWREIGREADELRAMPELLPRYHEVDPFVKGISVGREPKKNWRIFLLFAMGETPEAARKRAPVTTQLLGKIPELFQAFFSILYPGKSIPPHVGPYRGYLRYHLGLKVPVKDPPRLRVKDRWYTWREGGDVLFDDSLDHEVENTSTEARVVLIVDVLRPLPPLPARFNRWMTDQVIRRAYARQILKNLL